MTRWLKTLLVLAFLNPLIARSEPAESTTNIFAPKLQHFVDGQVMAGAVMLVADKDRVLDVEAVGYADLKSHRPMQVDDLFWIASMSKPITATALMMLVDEGKVRLGDPVEKYIAGFKKMKVVLTNGILVAPHHPITIREVLSHTSGLDFLNSMDKHVIDSAPLAESVQHDLKAPLLFEPGTSYKYSNEGIDTAGRIIEIVSGIPYEKFLQERLFTPLGMTQTTFNPSPAQLQRLATSYETRKDKNGLDEIPIQYLKSPLGGPGHYPAPGGGLFSTAHDLTRLCQMLANGGTFEGKTYLSREAVRQMTSKQTGPLVKEPYGLGFHVGHDYFGHGGAYKTMMEIDRGQIRIFLVQQANDWAQGNPEEDFTAEAREVYLPTQTSLDKLN